MFQTVADALNYIADHEIAMVDLKVAGLAGQWMHITIPARNFTQQHFEEGVGYDGSSGSGFGRVESGDVAARPDPATGFLDPFWAKPTLSFICSTVNADTKEPFLSDPRTIAQRAIARMQTSGIADEALVAPEFEFYVFDQVDVRNDPYETRVHIRSAEVETEGHSAPIPARRGYLRVPPSEKLHDLRSEISLLLESMGISVRYHHHEVGAPGQCEIEVGLDSLIRAADHAMIIKYVVKNVARRHGQIATFMPKPIHGEAGNGMHVHQKLELRGKHLFYDEKQKNYANLSDLALRYVGGLLNHGKALAGLTNASTNSYKRLVPGFEAPVNLFFSLGNRSAAIRVPKYAVAPKQKRIEYRPPDFAGNVYLSLAAMLLAGLDGIEAEIDPARNNFGPFDVDIATQPAEFTSRIAALPRTLDDALVALRADREFLTRGKVFTDAFLDNWIEQKRTTEADEIRSRPHPYEYALSLDV
jgi:glutamine synthetase